MSSENVTLITDNEKLIPNPPESGTDDTYQWDDVVRAYAMLPTKMEQVVKKLQKNESAPIYHAYAITITAGDVPTPLLGFDRSRKRALITLETAAIVTRIADRSTLSGGGLGMRLITGVPVELKHTDDMYVAIQDPTAAVGVTQVTVSIYVEKDLE